ncbi:hypothetical protein JKP88DRAFT_354549, partial [Tribonema minus]
MALRGGGSGGSGGGGSSSSGGGPDIVTLFPQSLTLGEIMGERDAATGDWREGVLPALLPRAGAGAHDSARYTWLVINTDMSYGPCLLLPALDAAAARRKLPLGSLERLRLPAALRVVFEAGDIGDASPAFVSRCALVRMPQDQVTPAALVRTWSATAFLSLLLPSVAWELTELLEHHLDAGIAHRRRRHRPPATPLPRTILALLGAVLRAAAAPCSAAAAAATAAAPALLPPPPPPRAPKPSARTRLAFTWCYAWGLGGGLREAAQRRRSCFTPWGAVAGAGAARPLLPLGGGGAVYGGAALFVLTVESMRKAHMMRLLARGGGDGDGGRALLLAGEAACGKAPSPWLGDAVPAVLGAAQGRRALDFVDNVALPRVGVGGGGDRADAAAAAVAASAPRDEGRAGGVHTAQAILDEEQLKHPAIVNTETTAVNGGINGGDDACHSSPATLVTHAAYLTSLTRRSPLCCLNFLPTVSKYSFHTASFLVLQLQACPSTEAAVQQLGGSWRPGEMEGAKANFQKAFASWRTGRSQGEIPGCSGDTWRVEGAASLLCSTDGVRCAGLQRRLKTLWLQSGGEVGHHQIPHASRGDTVALQETVVGRCATLDEEQRWPPCRSLSCNKKSLYP